MAANLSELVQRNAAEHPDRLAFIDSGSGERVTWADVESRVSRLASGLRAMGATPGQRAVLVLGNRLEFVLLYFAALRARLVVVPADPRGPASDLLNVLVDTSAALVAADESTAPAVREAVEGVAHAIRVSGEDASALHGSPRIVVVGGADQPGEVAYADLLATEPVSFPEAMDPENLAVMLATSGNEGRPRLAMITHRALLANIEQVQALDPPLVVQSDVVLGVLPMFHVFGLNAVLGICLGQAASLLLTDKFDVDGTLDLVSTHAVTVVPIAPPVLAYWRGVDDLAARLASVRTVLSGSAPVAPQLVREFETRTGVSVIQGYGLTEASPVVTIGGRDSRPDSVGRPVPGVELRISGEEEPGESDPDEILVKGDNLFSGYWPDGADGPGPDGWFGTGDIGYLDDSGELFLVDRAQEVIVVSGFNVYPREVEGAIREVDSVTDVVVASVPDSVTGEAVVAYVRRSPDSARADSEIADDVLAHCRERLAAFKRPATVVVSEELPHWSQRSAAARQTREALRRSSSGLIS